MPTVSPRDFIDSEIKQFPSHVQHLFRQDRSPNGQWVTVDTYPRTIRPSRLAPNTTGLNRSIDSLTMQLMLC